MQVTLMKSKILRAEVTQADADYEGSLAIDSTYMERVGLLPYEKILVGNITNGERLETYAIPAPAGSHAFCLNGAAAHKGKKGDLLVIMSFAQMDAEEAANFHPRVIVLDDSNRTIAKERTGTSADEGLFKIV
ncbi:aspartate 1-decarboxylase [Rubellicoccus peritrichatus]|uniref:Aspartate 1-decarboxylase n=1 Tax=Rubellicoccus peritrichatus TaxID=3080537 RepID=A0AAQ3LC47_9BACT|nr:aspartate 1-decarboxylase [Puniceicoccus sp. CR14]WOO42612.1 aspartate 1-decarboxylase [Puniceicoccus sp. CR14]